MSSEQMGEIPEQPEKKITTPEETAEMTRQRRLEFGLEADQKELSPEEKEVLEEKIELGLGDLYSYDPEELSPEMHEQFDLVGMEVEAGKDRVLAATQLEAFLETMRKWDEWRKAKGSEEGDKERISSREEILSQLGSRCEILKIERELSDEEGIYLLEVINKENTKRYTYQRMRLLPGQPRGIESSGTTIRSEDLDDGYSRTIADYDSETNEWTDQ